jgi:phosphohistidine swiveling domain-containing protein
MTATLTLLRKWIEGRDWVKGAVNFDEDLHFSSYYLRASCAPVTAPLYPGYSSFIAFYQNFNETYYLLKDECGSTAAAIVQRAARQPAWLPGILKKIRTHADALATAFPPGMTPAWLARQQTAALLALYRRHHVRHQALYKYARLPEALDRGGNYFSNYLRDHLQAQGMSAGDSDEIFAAFSHPAAPSVLAQEILDFNAIVETVRNDRALLSRLASGARAQMWLGPELRRRLEAHRDRWQFLSYHGYGRRELPTLDHYLERLAAQAGQPLAACPLPTSDIPAKRRRFEPLLRRKLDPGHRSLLKLYAEIGAVKLYRRYAQLRNFYYLDLLLAEIAQRLSVSEWTVRCMLPEEVVVSLQAGRLADRAIRDREDECVFARLDGREHIVAGKQAAAICRLLQAALRKSPHSNVLRGVVACRGHAAGPCRFIIRASDCREFAKGTIIVSEATDPDLVPYLRNAGAVLTEQGGVTSHAAIICRELGVPTIVGIDGLLDSVRDGDRLEVDAIRGVVKVMRAASEASSPSRPCLPATSDWAGAKAHNLERVRSFGFTTPEYVLLACKDALRIAGQPASDASRRVVRATLAALHLSNGATLALRSSAVDEDGSHGSCAGKYRSLLNVSKSKLGDAVCRFVKCNHLDNGTGYRGSIIVQRMIDADFAGVCLTREPRTGRDNALILELKTGGNQAITAGRLRPDRLVIDRLTGDILDEHRSSPASAGLQIHPLVKQFLKLEARFGRPLDIEWAVADGKLYILQARPIA